MRDGLPSYDQLPVREGAPAGSAWGLFGDDDQLGCLNLLTSDRVREAAGLVKRGSVFALGLPISLPCSSAVWSRGNTSRGLGKRWWLGPGRQDRPTVASGLKPVGWLSPCEAPNGWFL